MLDGLTALERARNDAQRGNCEYNLNSYFDIIEKELKTKQTSNFDGCPIEVITEACVHGFKYKKIEHKIGTQNEDVEQIYSTDYAYIYFASDIGAWFIATVRESFYLKDFGKTWWLKETKEE